MTGDFGCLFICPLTICRSSLIRSAICNNMDGPGGYYAKCNNSDRERQIPYDLCYMWNPKNKISGQTKQKQTPRYRENTDAWGLEI